MYVCMYVCMLGRILQESLVSHHSKAALRHVQNHPLKTCKLFRHLRSSTIPSSAHLELTSVMHYSVTSSTVIDKTDYSTNKEGKSANPDTRLNSGGSAL